MSMIRAFVLLALCACTFGIYLGREEKIADIEKNNGKLFNKIREATLAHFNRVFNVKENCASCLENNYYAFFHMQSVSKQVVAGVKYTATFVVVPTECDKNVTRALPALGKCPIKKAQDDSLPLECTASIHEEVWLNKFDVTDMKCLPKVTLVLHRSARSISGHEEASQVGSVAQFEIFKQIYKRSYADPENAKRFNIFHDNMQKAHVLNALEHGTAKYGMSPFADMTEEEFRNTRLSPEWDQTNMPKDFAKPPTAPAPTSFDWREHNAVTGVKNQGSCGSCWAFSTTGNVEGQWAIKKKKLISLSEQELVDCDKVDQGCGGGLPSNAYKAIMKLGGLELESVYPYEGENDKCKFQKSDVRAYVNGSVALPQDEGQLAAWLAQNGPISIGINAFAMQFYMGGISHPWSFLCSPARLDHGVLIVGYGVQGSTPFWTIKNSWGPLWGEKGYYLVYRGAGVCGLNRMATSSVVQ